MVGMSNKNILFGTITIILFFIPFFWFNPGETDIGGDSTRLYFYDPISYLKAQTLYGVIPSGIGGENVGYYAIPYVVLLWIVKSVVQSPTILINIFQGISLSVAFLSIAFIVKDLLNFSGKGKSTHIELIASISGIFYILTPTLVLGWDKEILTHNQIFLNPLMFFLLFRFITRNSIRYLLGALLTSFIFAPNFAFVAAPPFFAFYPLAIIFILIYTKFILKKLIPVKLILLGLLLFVLLHLFHLGPHISSLFIGGSQINANVFSEESKFSRGLSYFMGVAPSVKVSYSLLNLAQLYELKPIDYSFIIFPLIILLGFLWNRKKQYLLTAIFFSITFFFVTANITNIGFNIYKSLFDLPGFSMFRNYFGQWVFVYTFFYTLLFGQALQMLFQKLHIKYVIGITSVILSILIINSWPFLNGDLLNKKHHQSNVKITSQLDPEYEKVLAYIKNLQVDGKFISFPLPDAGYQILTGKNGGAYQGPSTISYLTGKNDFTGYDGLIPFNETFLTLVKNNDIEGINRLFSILNVRYIFYNSDPSIYDNTFPQYPYTYVRKIMPKDQRAYKSFLSTLPIRKIKSFGDKYHIYEVNNFLPHLYIANNYIYAFDPLSPYFILDLNESLRSVVYSQGELPQKGSDVILNSKNVNPLFDLINNYHLHPHAPFISRSMDNLLYPLVVLKEKRNINDFANDPTAYVDQSLLHMAKRVFELQSFNQTPITHEVFIEPQIWQIYNWKKYNSWEASLTRFSDQAELLISWINLASLSETRKYTEKIKVNEGLSQNHYRLRKIIDESSYSDDDKAYLKAKVDSLFIKLFTALDLKTFEQNKIPYSLDIPEGLIGKYIPYLRSEKDADLDPSLYSISINNLSSSPESIINKSSLITFKPINIKSIQSDISLEYKPENILGSSQWVGSGQVNNSGDETILVIDDQFGKGSGFSRKITQYEPEQQYIITFEYYTEKKDILFNLHEKINQNNKYFTQNYFDKILTSRSWKKHQSIITSSGGATEAYVQFKTLDNNYADKLHIKNLSVMRVSYDTLIFRKVDENKVIESMPTIRFNKINPTRYTINIKNASKPYALVFSEAFSNNWKLYLSSTNKKPDKITNTYFDRQVTEGQHSNVFFDFSFLNNDKPVMPSKHTIANGYANVWYISPQNVENKKEYTLDLIYQPQIRFYYYLAVSIITFVVLVISMIIIVIRNKYTKT